MREVRLLGSRGLVLRALVPETRGERMRGLRGHPTLPADAALLLDGTRSIHTFGMRFAIVAALLDRDLVVRRARSIPPGRLLLPRPGIRHVLECAEGINVLPGDRLRIVADG
ncbi:MAG TPA: DUF192 domain-containing protein [Actinomycetota bacterium]